MRTMFNKIIESFDYNPATLSGAVDIIVVEQDDGSLKSTPFHVRFGKFKGVLKPKDKEVQIQINGELMPHIMRLGEEGDAYFEELRQQKRKPSEDFKSTSDNEQNEQQISDNTLSGGEDDYQYQKMKNFFQQEPDLLQEIEKGNSPKQQYNSNENLQFLNNSNQQGQSISLQQNNSAANQKKGLLDYIPFFKAKQQKETTEKKFFTPTKQNLIEKEVETIINISNNNTQNNVSAVESVTNIQKQKIEEEKNKGQQNSNINQNQIIIKTSSEPPVPLQKQNIQQVSPQNKQQQQQIKEEIKQQQQQQIDGKTIDKQNEEVYQGDEKKEEEEEDEEDDEINEIDLSLSQHLMDKDNKQSVNEIFQSKKVSFEDFKKDPMKILSDKNLLIRIKDQVYQYDTAILVLISHLAFKQQLPNEILKQTQKSKGKGFFGGLFSFKKDVSTQNQQLPRKNNQTNAMDESNMAKNKQQQQLTDQNQKKAIVITQVESREELEDQEKISTGLSQNNLDKIRRKLSDDASDSQSSPKKQFRIKIGNRPSSEILKDFKLKKGYNKIVYFVNGVTGASLEAQVYLLSNNAQIVISDIDGTITKSDVLGQVGPLIGMDWTHKGVANLYNSIYNNGYQILYLTARAIGQSKQTRDFLNNLIQQDLNLPHGPVFMSSDRIFKSFKREVIDKKPEVFKIQVLREIKNLFKRSNPFYAGFGNKDTDAIAYRSVDISMGKIFLINPDSQLHMINNTYKNSYTELNEMVDYVFPHMQENEVNVTDEYNNCNYWSISYNKVSVSDILDQN